MPQAKVRIPDLNMTGTPDSTTYLRGDGLWSAITDSAIIAALGYTPENLANKQNSLTVDGTGTKYPTVDAVNAALPKSYSQIVYVNSTNPNTATIFDTVNPPVTNNNVLKTDVNNLYIGTDASTWVYDLTIFNYVTKSLPAVSNFYISGSSADAGNNKINPIYRVGTIQATGFIKSGGFSSQFLKADGSSDSTTYTTNLGTVTSVTAGNGMTQSGTSTINPTLNIVSHAGSAGTIGTINIGADAIGVNLGTTSTTAAAGNDARLSDARTPLAHNQAWSTITSTPTTLSGYGITDAAPLSGSANYIQNQNASAQSANMWINGIVKTVNPNVGWAGWIENSAVGGSGLVITSGDTSGTSLLVRKKDGTETFSVQGTGAATFASSVTVKGGMNLVSNNVNEDNVSYTITNTAASKIYSFTTGKQGITHNGVGIWNRTDNTHPIWFEDNGAATFASTVTASNGTLIGGTLTSGYIPKATGVNSIGNSLIYDNGTNVGIGTTSPSTLLHLYKTSFPVLTIGSGSVTANMGIDTSDLLLNIGTETNHPFKFSTNNSEKMRITSSGNVGIGTTNPNQKFVVSNTGANGIEFAINATPTDGSVIQSYDRVSAVYRPLNYDANVHIFSQGNVLIGTTTDNGSKLRVEGDTYISGKVSLGQSTYHKPATTQCAGEIVKYGTGTTVAGKLYYLSTGLVWTLADSDAAASSSGMLGIAIGTNPATNGMLVRGSARFDALTPYTAMTAGQILYVSTTAGDFTATAPTGTGKVVRVIGYCVDDTNNTLYFCPDNTWIELT